jgi:hypothetical protein
MEEKPIIDNNISIYNYELSIKLLNEKSDYYSVVIEKLTKFKSLLEKFHKEKLENIKIKEDIHSESSEFDDNYMNLILLIKEEINLNIKGSLNVIKEIMKNLTNIRETIRANNKIFIDYLNIKNSYNTKLSELQNCKIKYYNTAEKAEKATFEFLDKKIHNKTTEMAEFEKKNKLQENCKEEKEKYILKVNEVNEKVDIVNEKQENVFNINKDIKKIIYENYTNSLFSFYQYTSEGPEFSEKKQEIKNKIIEITNKSEKLNNLQYKEEKKIVFIQYTSKIDFDNCYDTFEMGTFITVCEEMKKVIGDYVQDEIAKCRNKTELNAKLNKMLSLDDKLPEEWEKEILESILNNEIGQNLFINNLSKLRTTGKLKKSQKFIEFLGKALIKLINYERDHTDYKYIKSCLILSQTFYYLDLKDEKKYIFEYLSNNKWLKSPNFWRNFIESMLNIEFKKTNLIRLNLSDLLFTQLIPYIKNMKDFNIDDRIIIKIIDEILKKFDYIENKKYANLFVFINNDQKEIEKLRKEYQDNPDLEKQLYKEELEEKIDENEDKNEKENIFNSEKENIKENNENKNEISNEKDNNINKKE